MGFGFLSCTGIERFTKLFVCLFEISVSPLYCIGFSLTFYRTVTDNGGATSFRVGNTLAKNYPFSFQCRIKCIVHFLDHEIYFPSPGVPSLPFALNN